MTAEKIVQQNLNCYNRRDIEGFMTWLSDDIALFDLGETAPSLTGTKAVRAFYSELFSNSPNLYSSIAQRIVLGDTVIDHERIVGRNGSMEEVELVLVYQVRADKIFRITVIRE